MLNLLIGIIGISALAHFGSISLLQRMVDPEEKKIRTRIEQRISKQLEDQQVAKVIATITNSSQQKDAGPFLNPRLVWEGGESEKPENAIAIPGPIVEQLKMWGIDFMSHASEVEFANLDFTWMTKLHDFDFWDLDQSGPLAEYEPKAADALLAAPLPRWSPYNWAKLRLMKSVADNSTTQALLDIRQLVSLLFSSERHPASLQAISVLRIVELALPTLTKNDPTFSSEWVKFSFSDLERTRRAIGSLPDYLGPLAPMEVRNQVLSDGAMLGICGAIFEVTSVAYANWLFEEEYKSIIDSELAKASSCRLTLLKRIIAQPFSLQHESNFLDQASKDTGIPRFLLVVAFKVPKYRQTIGKLMTTLATPDYLSSIERSASKF